MASTDCQKLPAQAYKAREKQRTLVVALKYIGSKKKKISLVEIRKAAASGRLILHGSHVHM